MYLVLKVAFVEDGGVVCLLELGELLLEQLALVAGAAVLEPDGDLLGVEAELGGQVHLPAGLQLPLLPEAQFQHLYLLVAQPPLLGVPSPVQVAAAAAPRCSTPPAPRSRPLPLRRACTSHSRIHQLPCMHAAGARLAGTDDELQLHLQRWRSSYRAYSCSWEKENSNVRVRTVGHQEGWGGVHVGGRKEPVVFLHPLPALPAGSASCCYTFLSPCQAWEEDWGQRKREGGWPGRGDGMVWCGAGQAAGEVD